MDPATPLPPVNEARRGGGSFRSQQECHQRSHKLKPLNSPTSPVAQRTQRKFNGQQGLGDHWRPSTPRNREELAKVLKELEERAKSLPGRTKPKVLELRQSMKAYVRVQRIQKYISSLEYNHTGTNYFNIRKDRGQKRLAATAREIMRECLPIKCIDAVFLGYYLTLNMSDMIRVPIRFQSRIPGENFHFKHIVMAVKASGKWGAIGLSRKSSLMYKELKFSSLSCLLRDFRESYEQLDHELEHVGVGLPFGNDEHSGEPIHWRPLMIHFTPEQPWNDLTEKAIDAFISKLDLITSFIATHGTLPGWFYGEYPNVQRPAKGLPVEDAAAHGPKPPPVRLLKGRVVKRTGVKPINKAKEDSKRTVEESKTDVEEKKAEGVREDSKTSKPTPAKSKAVSRENKNEARSAKAEPLNVENITNTVQKLHGANTKLFKLMMKMVTVDKVEVAIPPAPPPVNVTKQ